MDDKTRTEIEAAAFRRFSLALSHSYGSAEY